MKILIVDDEEPIGAFLAESVKLQGHTAVVAQSGAEGLRLLEREQPDAVFLDIVMPEMNGVEMLRRLRQTHPTLPVIVITGHASAEEIDAATALGVTECVEKPFILKQLHQALGRLTPRTGPRS